MQLVELGFQRPDVSALEDALAHALTVGEVGYAIMAALVVSPDFHTGHSIPHGSRLLGWDRAVRDPGHVVVVHGSVLLFVVFVCNIVVVGQIVWFEQANFARVELLLPLVRDPLQRVRVVVPEQGRDVPQVFR